MFRTPVAGALAALALIAAASPAPAQEPRIGQAQVYQSVTASDLSTLLNGMSFASVKKGENQRFDIETTSGFKFSVEPMVCDVEGEVPGCLGISLFATWTLDPADRTKLTAVVDRFNNEYRIGKALLLDDSIYAERYVITDGGVTLRHLTEEVTEFEAAMGAFSDLMAEALGQ